MKYYLKVLREYANFKGRARRSEYWYFVLFYYIFSVVATGADVLVNMFFKFDPSFTLASEFGIIFFLYFLAMIIPGLAVTVRRLHDTGRSGIFILLVFIPLIGGIWLLILLFTDSDFGENKYGLNPKDIGNHDEIDQIGSYITT